MLWAKLKGKEASWHPLICHLQDVANVARVLWDNVITLNVKRIFFADQRLPYREQRDLIAYWTGLHDLGKATPAFQGKSGQHQRALESLGLHFSSSLHLHKAPRHDTLTEVALSEYIESSCDHLPADEKRLLKRVAKLLAGHHGEFPRSRDDAGHRIYAGDKSWTQIRQELVHSYNQFFEVSPLTGEHAYVFQENSSLIILAGLISVADWIASNTEFFPSILEDVTRPSLDLHAYNEKSLASARKAIDFLAWSKWRAEFPARDFSRIFNLDKPRPLQSTAVELARNIKERTLFIIEAPMGEGKTEAALYLASQLIASLGNKGMYVALPTQTTSDQMFDRVRKFLAACYPDQVVGLHLLHANSMFDESYRKLVVSSVGEKPQSNVIATEWFLSKKRALLAPFGVGTIDQALISVLQTRHYFVRIFGLAGKTVILDEVHAYDTYTTVIMEKLLEWLSALGCNVILLSATLPGNKREKLIKAFNSNVVSLPTFSYPSITQVSAKKIDVFPFKACSTKSVKLSWINESELCEKLSSIMRPRCKAAFVCNTVDKAQKLYEAFKGARDLGKIDLRLLHARFLLRERRNREQQVVSLYGPKSGRKSASVLISTQIIEQSLDLDFDLMISELAPADLILQRMGRLHRHERSRPESMKSPEFWIIEPEKNEKGLPVFGGSGKIYSEYLLMKSYVVLKSKAIIKLPEDLPRIVEMVYDQDSAQPGVSDAWQKLMDGYFKKYKQKVSKLENEAKRNAIRAPDFSGDILDQIFRDLKEDDPDAHPARQALTRYGPPSVRVICLDSPDGKDDHPALHEEPDFERARELVLNSVPISHRPIVDFLKQKETPGGWRRQAVLRGYKYLIFRDGTCEVEAGKDIFELKLDKELGLVINKIS